MFDSGYDCCPTVVATAVSEVRWRCRMVMTACFVEADDGTARNGSCGRLQNCKALRTEGQSVEIDLGLADFENLSIVTIR